MLRQVFLRPGELPPEDDDYVHVSIVNVGRVAVARRFGDTLESASYFETDTTSALAKSMTIAERWAEERGLQRIYISRNPSLAPDA